MQRGERWFAAYRTIFPFLWNLGLGLVVMHLFEISANLACLADHVGLDLVQMSDIPWLFLRGPDRKQKVFGLDLSEPRPMAFSVVLIGNKKYFVQAEASWDYEGVNEIASW